MHGIRKTGPLQPTLPWFGTNGFQRRFYIDIKRIGKCPAAIKIRMKVNSK